MTWIVELLCTEGCPNAEALLCRLRVLVAQAGGFEPVRVRRIDDVAQARRERFLGSPTVRVNGTDVKPEAASRHDYGLACRLYPGPAGLCGYPPDAWISARLRSGSRA